MPFPPDEDELDELELLEELLDELLEEELLLDELEDEEELDELLEELEEALELPDELLEGDPQAAKVMVNAPAQINLANGSRRRKSRSKIIIVPNC